jgi:hypothetical protein
MILGRDLLWAGRYWQVGISNSRQRYFPFKFDWVPADPVHALARLVREPDQDPEPEHRVRSQKVDRLLEIARDLETDAFQTAWP